VRAGKIEVGREYLDTIHASQGSPAGEVLLGQ
jgi:hypothetical protein